MDVHFKSLSFVSLAAAMREREEETRKNWKVKKHNLNLSLFSNTQIKSSSWWMCRKRFLRCSGSEINTFPTVFFEWNVQEENQFFFFERFFLLLHGLCYRGEMMNEFCRLCYMKMEIKIREREKVQRLRSWLRNVVMCGIEKWELVTEPCHDNLGLYAML